MISLSQSYIWLRYRLFVPLDRQFVVRLNSTDGSRAFYKVWHGSGHSQVMLIFESGKERIYASFDILFRGCPGDAPVLGLARS